MLGLFRERMAKGGMENMIWRFQRQDVEKRGWVEEYRDES